MTFCALLGMQAFRGGHQTLHAVCSTLKGLGFQTLGVGEGSFTEEEQHNNTAVNLPQFSIALASFGAGQSATWLLVVAERSQWTLSRQVSA